MRPRTRAMVTIGWEDLSAMLRPALIRLQIQTWWRNNPPWKNALHTCAEILGTRTAKEFTLRRQRGLSTLLDTQLSCSSTLARIKTEWGKDAKNRDQMDGAEAGS